MRNLFFVIIIIYSQLAHSQIKVGKWRDHFSYNNCIAVCKSTDKIYGATPTGVFWYNLQDGQTGKISRVNGLNDITISSIEYSDGKKVLAVGYDDGNIDLVFKDRILNMPQIKEKLMQGSKRINGFTFYNDLIYVSTDFGVVAIDLSKEEIKDTYFIGDLGASIKINRTIIQNGNIYAATETGLLKADVNDPFLIQYQHWVRESGFTSSIAGCSDVTTFGQYVIAVEENDESQKDIIWAINGSTWVEVGRPYNTVSNIRGEEGTLAVTSTEGISTYSTINAIPASFTSYLFTWLFQPDMAIVLQSGKLAIADHYSGIVFGEIGNFISVHPGGPTNNRAFALGVSRQKVIVATGAYDATYTNMWYPLSYHMFENEQWVTYEDGSHSDAVRVLFNPANPDEYYISSWGKGIVQFQNNVQTNEYNPANSTLQSIIPGADFCRVGGLTYDESGNLWVANLNVPKPVSVRKVDGSWYSFAYATAISSERISGLFNSPNGMLWFILPKGAGLFVLNHGSNIESASDDTYRKFLPTDVNGNSLPSDIYSLAFDHDGYLWIGTSEGVLISYNPEDAISASKFQLQRVKIPDVVQGLAAYLLQTETVTTITVDGGNRKWFGTSKSGVYLQTSDGSKQIQHFTMQNSPLPSNSIVDIKIHPTTGEVFIATDKGVISYRGDATEASDRFGKVYAFPNPVKPNYSGVITITGLVENTTVKITDISGNLVYETQSNGGVATWDGKNLNGHRVATGVYLIFCSDSKGDQTAVSKLLFIK